MRFVKKRKTGFIHFVWLEFRETSYVFWIRFLAVCYISLTLSNTTFAKPLHLIFTSVVKGKEILLVRDEFIKQLSPFDKSARLKVQKDVTEKEFLVFISRQVLSWRADEEKKVLIAIEKIKLGLAKFCLNFPSTIYLIKTTGKEEGNAAYTRGQAIIIPQDRLESSQERLTHLVAHELFHILSRYQKELREQLYQVIGFKKYNKHIFPTDLEDQKITNPDAPRNFHWIRIKFKDNFFWAAPILFSKTKRYDSEQGDSFFQYLEFRLLLVSSTDGELPLISDEYDFKMVKVEEVSGFFDQIGRNTQYVIHPEEIIAENFVFIVLEENQLPSPKITGKIRKLLAKNSNNCSDRQLFKKEAPPKI